jgi:predicted metal-dependent hydrolase
LPEFAAGWLGYPVSGKGAIVFSAEDDDDELHRRLTCIAREEGPSIDCMKRLGIRSLVTESAALCTFKTGENLAPTRLYNDIASAARDFGTDLLVLNTLAEMAPFDENQRVLASSFIRLLRQIAVDCNCAVVVLAHPSLSGISTGRGTSGSTGWNNAVRSRLYMERIVDRNGNEMDKDARRLTRLSWIKKKQREFAGQARETERRYVSGETHFVFGKPLRLAVRTSLERGCSIQLEGSDRLAMVVPKGSSMTQKDRWLVDWYRRELKQRATPRIAKWTQRLGVPEPRWSIRQMHTKWGSCNPDKNLIWLNLELAKKPLQSLDYVILHEMAHLISRHHDDVFIGILDKQMPGWRQIKADLNALPLSTRP